MRLRKLWLGVGIVVIFALGLFAGRQVYLMGNTESAATPENTQGYTLDDVYERLDTGVVNAQTTFTEPGVAPGQARCTPSPRSWP